MPSQAYYELDGQGDWYEALQDTSPGESPVTHPEKWAKLAIPAIFESFLVERAAAIVLAGDGQDDKAKGLLQESERSLTRLAWRHRDAGDNYRATVGVR